MRSIRRITWAIAACFTLAIAPSVFAIDDDELRAQQANQRQVQADTDAAVSRITTMLRVMKFYGVESPEKKIMGGRGDTLSKLSKNQMADVIHQLEKAAVAKTEKQSEEAYAEAQKSHQK